MPLSTSLAGHFPHPYLSREQHHAPEARDPKVPILKALPRTAKSSQSGGLNARVVDDVPKRLDRPRGAALVFRTGRAPVFALASAAGKKGHAEG